MLGFDLLEEESESSDDDIDFEPELNLNEYLTTLYTKEKRCDNAKNDNTNKKQEKDENNLSQLDQLLQ